MRSTNDRARSAIHNLARLVCLRSTDDRTTFRLATHFVLRMLFPCMRTLLSAALCAATISAVGGAGSRAEDPASSGDLAKLQGQWTATFGPQNVVVVLAIKGNSAVLSFTRADGQSVESKGEIKIDENAKPHKTLDWVNFTSPAGTIAPANLGIYKLSGDAITVRQRRPGQRAAVRVQSRRRRAAAATVRPESQGCHDRSRDQRWRQIAGPMVHQAWPEQERHPRHHVQRDEGQALGPHARRRVARAERRDQDRRERQATENAGLGELLVAGAAGPATPN